MKDIMEGAAPKFNTQKYLFLKQGLATDLLNLDEELQRISVYIQDAAENAAVANELRDAAKENFNLVAAKASSRLREEPTSTGKARSETQIASELPLCPDYQEAQGTLSEARLDAALWATLSDAFRTKSSSLRAAADLIGAGYITQDYLTQKRRVEQRGAVRTIVQTREIKSTA